METSFSVDIVPHLMDPNGDPVKLLNLIGEIIAEQFSSDISAKIEFSGECDYMFEFYLPEHCAGVYLRLPPVQIREAMSKGTVFSKLAGSFVDQLNKEVEKAPLQEWAIAKAHQLILITPIANHNVIIPLLDRHGGLWQVEFTPKGGKWEFVRVK